MAATLTHILTEYNYNAELNITHAVIWHWRGNRNPQKNEKKYIFRTTEEIQSGELQWPFWTKLVVVAIGFTGMILILSKELQLPNKLL